MRCGERIDPETLRRVLSYDIYTGIFLWRDRTPDMFEDTLSRTKEHICANWNSIHSGKICFNQNHASGYKMGTVWNVKYLAHRAAWAIHYGYWPHDMIDHINMDKGDNRIANLREADMSRNKRNTSRLITNTSGYKGVSLCKYTGRWKSSIKVNGESIWLGRHDTAELAWGAYSMASKKYHGEYGRV